MNYSEIISKKGCRVLITGCSTSYNRFSYDETPRTEATECGVGMGSWSFRLRDTLIFGDSFIFGSDIDFSSKSVLGIDNNSPIPNTALFNGKIKTLYPEGDVSFDFYFEGETAFLYLQTRLDSPCIFDIAADGKTVLKAVDTRGDEGFYAGYSMLRLPVLLDKEKTLHTLQFKNISGEKAKITVAGIGKKDIEVNLSGRGSQTANFFLTNFEERIGKYAPDLLIFNIGANDRVLTPPRDFGRDLKKLFTTFFERFPDSKILYVFPLSSLDPNNPNNDSLEVGNYSSIQTIELYDKMILDAVTFFGREKIDIFNTRSFFEGIEISEWRYDNIHLNKKGNDILYDAVLKHLNLQ